VLAPNSIETDSGIGRPGNGSTSDCGWQGLGGEPKPREVNGFQRLETVAETTDSLVEQSLEGARQMRETSSEGDPFDRRGRGRRRGTRTRKRGPPCGVLHRAEAALELLRGTHRRPRTEMPVGLVSSGRQVEPILSAPRSGCVGLQQCSADELQGCERIAQQPGNQLHSAGGLADAQSTPSVSSTTSVRAQPSQVRGGNLEDADQERPFSSDRSGNMGTGLQARERVKDRNELLHSCRGERDWLWGYRCRNASVGRSGMDATCERGRPTPEMVQVQPRDGRCRARLQRWSGEPTNGR
jgi:hypothetical protein